MQRDYSVEVEWRPYLLRPDMPPEGMPSTRTPAQRQQSFPRLQRMAAEAGLEIADRDRLSNSRPAHEAAEHAADLGLGEAFRRVLFHAYWVEGRDIGDVETLSAIGEAVGLDPDELRRALAEGRYREHVEVLAREAHDLGIPGVPTTFAGRRAVVGAQPYAAFRALMEEAHGPASC
ncbi:MAG: DsbA family protein [Chloroflexi bacterium]|nr:DsbA family protein [Chloroflexota bacterium]